MYKLVVGLDGEPAPMVFCQELGFIPFDPANTDYQEYLEWVAEGNQPLPAEETE